MTDLSTTINGNRVTAVTVRMPASGVWWAECDLDTAIELPTSAVLRCGPLEASGTVVPQHSGSFANRTKLRIVGGKNGWAKKLEPKHYHSDAGVRVSTVVRDCIREAGETEGTIALTTERLGVDFVRQASKASNIMVQALSLPWWVGLDGKTNVGTRPEVEVLGKYELLNYDPKTRKATLSTEDPSLFTIGSVIRERLDEPLVVQEIELSFTKTLRITVWGSHAPSPESRFLDVAGELCRRAFPSYAFGSIYRYRVVSMASNRVDLQAVSKAPGLPDVLPVPIHPGMAGLSATLTPGSIVLVQFVEGNPAMPIITHFSSKDEPGFIPLELFLQAGATGAWPTEHVASIEGIANLLCQVAIQAPALITLLPPSLGGTGGLALALAAASSTPMDPTVKAAIIAALEAKQPDPTGLAPGVGWPSVRGA